MKAKKGCDAVLETLPADMKADEKAALMKKAYSTLILCLGDRVLREVIKETTAAEIWTKLTKGHLKRDCPIKKTSGFFKKGKRDQDSDSSDDKGNAYFEEALVVVRNDEMAELVMDSGRWDRESKVIKVLLVMLNWDPGNKNFVYTLEAKVKQLGPGVKQESMAVKDGKRVGLRGGKLQAAQRDREVEVYHVSTMMLHSGSKTVG
ncbi:hypothetical protein Tco_0738738 [Tanacetum coccineum]